MRTRAYLPNLPLLGEEGAWSSIVEIVERRLLPAIEAVGDAVFSHPLQPLPEKAIIAPIVSEAWSRPRRDGTPQFVYLIAGNGFMLVDGELLALRTGEGFFLAKETLYAPYLMLGDQVTPCDWLWFKVHPFGVVVLRAKLTPKAHYQSAHYVLVERRLVDLFAEWERERLSLRPNRHLTKGLLLSFFGLLTRLLPFPPSEQSPSNVDSQHLSLPIALQHALIVLHRAYNKPITLNQLASHCGVTPAYLCRLFRRHLGITPWQYLEQLRLKVAHYLLRETSLSIADVAFLAGFNDLRHFQRMFQRAYKTAPSQVRKGKGRQAPFLRVW